MLSEKTARMETSKALGCILGDRCLPPAGGRHSVPSKKPGLSRHVADLFHYRSNVLFVPLITAPEVPCPIWVISGPSRHVRFTPESGHRAAPGRCPLCAKEQTSATSFDYLFGKREERRRMAVRSRS